MKPPTNSIFYTLLIGLSIVFIATPSMSQPWVYEDIPSKTVLRNWLILGPIKIADVSDTPDFELVHEGFLTNLNQPLQDAFDKNLLADSGGENYITPKEGDTVEIAGATYTWRVLENEEHAIRLHEQYEMNNALLYAYAEIDAGQQNDAAFSIGSDDAVKFWFNDNLIYQYRGGRALNLDDDTVFVLMEERTNRILLKVLNMTHDWGFSCRYLAPQDFPVSEVVSREAERIVNILSDPTKLSMGRLVILLFSLAAFLLLIVVLFLFWRYYRNRMPM